MPDYRLNLDTLNAIAATLGDAGSHAREAAALNAICRRVGGTGGHARTLAALNEWAVRLGDAGGHRRSVAAANAISRRLGGAGGHVRTLAALDEIAARMALPDPVTSGAVRAQMMVGQSGTYAGGERATHRLRDRSNVAVARPWLEFFHGRILSSGVVDTELETGLAAGVAAKYRAAILTGISGTGKNQAGATVHRATFLGMAADAAFVAAGGAVSGDGRTVTVPNGWRFRSDRLELSLTAGEEYFVQTECVAANGSVAPNPRGRACIPALGDLTFNEAAASTADTVFRKDWSAVWNAALTSAFGPVAVLGSGSAPVVIVDGDSIICDLAAPGSGASGTDAGDAFGVKNFAKRALNARGYAFIDVSVAGTNVGNFMAGYGRSGIRADLMKYGAAVITDHLHNDRRSTTPFAATAGWTEANRGGVELHRPPHPLRLAQRLAADPARRGCAHRPLHAGALHQLDRRLGDGGGPDRPERRRRLGGRLRHRQRRRPVQAQRPDHAPRRLRRARLRRRRRGRRGLRPLRRGRGDGRRPVAGGWHHRRHPPEPGRSGGRGRGARAAAAGAARLLSKPAAGGRRREGPAVPPYRASSRMPASRPASVIGYMRPSKIAPIMAVERL